MSFQKFHKKSIFSCPRLQRGGGELFCVCYFTSMDEINISYQKGLQILRIQKVGLEINPTNQLHYLYL